MPGTLPTIAILGASGLIGEALALALAREGFPVVPIARRFAPHQATVFGAAAITAPVVELSSAALARIFADARAEIVVNCIGVLQDGPAGRTSDVHVDFVSRLLGALATGPAAPLLVHLSVPGEAEDDATRFSRSKRLGEQMIAAGSAPYVILRPGFVLAEAAYGGSALMRALALSPFALPAAEAERPFAVTAVSDLTRTVSLFARRWRAGARDMHASYDVMARDRSTVGSVLNALRGHLGGPRPWWTPPSSLLTLGAKVGDWTAYLGWQPPVRGTALAELRRGLDGDPEPWMAATGLVPLTPAAAVAAIASSVQERWFARLYLLKAVVLATLAVFWLVSGLIALTVAFAPAVAILTAHGWALLPAKLMTVLTSLMDIVTGLAIAFRRTCRTGLIAGLVLAAVYMVGGVALTPELWLDPLGALVKIFPAIVLMLVALAILDSR